MLKKHDSKRARLKRMVVEGPLVDGQTSAAYSFDGRVRGVEADRLPAAGGERRKQAAIAAANVEHAARRAHWQRRERTSCGAPVRAPPSPCASRPHEHRAAARRIPLAKGLVVLAGVEVGEF